MDRMAAKIILPIFLIASVLLPLEAQTASYIDDDMTLLEEVNAHNVSVKFYQLQKSKWLSSEPKFRRVLAENANEFCDSEPSQCGFPSSWRRQGYFKEQDMKIQSTKSDRIYFSLTLYLVIPNNISKPELTKTKYILHKDTTEDIIVKSRKELDDIVGSTIVSIGEFLFTPSPNHTRNIVLICISFIVVLIVSGIAIYFKVRESRDRKNLRKKVMQQKAAGRGSSRENIAIVRPSEKEPVVMVTPPQRSSSPPLKSYREPASNDHSQRKPERESFLHLRGRAAPYALPESSIITAPPDKVKFKPWKQSEKSGHETPV